MKITDFSDLILPEDEFPKGFHPTAIRECLQFVGALPSFALTTLFAYYVPGRISLSFFQDSISGPTGSVRVYFLKVIPLDFLLPALLGLAFAAISVVIAFFPLHLASRKVGGANSCVVDTDDVTVAGHKFAYKRCGFLLDQNYKLTCVDEDSKVRKTIRPSEYRQGMRLVATVAFGAHRNRSLEPDSSLRLIWERK